MRVVYHLSRESAASGTLTGPLALAVSDWDGAHRGHLALAQRTAAQAARLGAQAVALLPWPSPAGADGAPSVRLTTLEERIAGLAAFGVFETLVIAPTPPAAPETAPEASAALAWLRGLGETRALLSEAQPRAAVARLWPAGLAEAARAAGVIVEQEGDTSGESERIRGLVEAGRMREATAALGYAYTLTGEVVGGDRRGRLLGFPTANMRAEPSKLTPGNGIYAAWAWLPGDQSAWPAAVSIGVRPTFGQGAQRQVEAHLLDVTMDLYGLQLRLSFVDWLRAELRFESAESLIEQMNADREHSRRILRAEAMDAG